MSNDSSRRTFLATLGALTAAGLGAGGRSLAAEESASGNAAAGTDAWPQFRANAARTGAVGAAAAPDGEYATEAWTARSGELVSVSEPTVGDGAVYRPFVVDDVSFRGGVVAFDAATGEERWRRVAPPHSRAEGWPTGIGRVDDAPAVRDGRLYLTSEPGYEDVEYGGLHALDTETGETAWAKTESRWRGSPLVADGALYVVGTPGEDRSAIHALDPETGDVRWTTGNSYDSRYVGLADGTLYGMRTYTDADNELVAWSAEDGSVRWVTEVENGVNFLDAAVGGDSIYRSAGGETDDGPNEVVAHDASDGRVRWRTTLTPEGERPRAHLGAPAVADGTVYVHTGPSVFRPVTEYGRGALSTVYALDAASGEVRWTHDTSTALLGDPSVAGGAVYVGGHAVQKKEREEPSVVRRYPTVHALAADDGAERWSHLVREESEGAAAAMTPALAGGRVYAGMHESDADAREGVFALAAGDVAPDAENLPISSDAPVARIATDPENAENADLDAGATVTLDGSPSAGDVDAYEWDLDEDGTFETAGRTAEVTLDFCGSLVVALRATGPGGTSTTSVTLSTVAR